MSDPDGGLESTSDVLIALGPTQGPELLRLAGRYDMAVFELQRPIDQVFEVGERDLHVAPLSGSFPMVLVRRRLH